MSNDENKRFDQLIEKLSDMAVSFALIANAVESLDKSRDDHEERVRSLEKWKNNLSPVLAAGTFILGGIAMAVIRYLSGL